LAIVFILKFQRFDFVVLAEGLFCGRACLLVLLLCLRMCLIDLGAGFCCVCSIYF